MSALVWPGAVAARELDGAGVNVLVIVARDRVGGRTLTERVEGVPVEMGGQWIGSKQHRISTLAREIGVETFPDEVPGRTVLYEGGRRSEYEEGHEVPLSGSAAYREAERAFLALSSLRGRPCGSAVEGGESP